MPKWLSVAGLAVLAVLMVLWRQLHEPAVVAAPQDSRPSPMSSPALAVAPASVHAAVMPSAAPAAEPPTSDKLDVESDAFFYKFQELVPAQLSRNAVKCYEGIAKRVHRNQSLVLKFKTRIRSGVVTIHDVEIEKNTLDDPALAACFIQEVQRSTWTDESLPDWEADDQLVLNPERGLKKYTRANLEYVGG
jgi:hypothetical protein